MHNHSHLKNVPVYAAAAFAAVLAAAALSGCGRQTASSASGSSADSSETSSQTENPKPVTDFILQDDVIAVNRGDQLTIGFSQIGAESDWRLASTSSVERTFTSENGYNLIFNDAQQKQENQIKAVREFIDQDVDYIIIDPTTETGWDSSLAEAKDAGIPVIIADREIDVSDDSLYTVWVGSDFRLEGDRACAWLETFLEQEGWEGDVGIVDIQGTIGASAQLGRTEALEAAVSEHDNWNLLKSESGDFVQAKGSDVMEELLEEFGDEINVVYCENDNMAYGAIEALEAAGKKAGTDINSGEIVVISFDAARNGLELTLAGTIACDAECNPLYGPILSRTIMALERGDGVQKKTYYDDEEHFSAYDGISEVTVNGREYPVVRLTDELIEMREY